MMESPTEPPDQEGKLLHLRLEIPDTRKQLVRMTDGMKTNNKVHQRYFHLLNDSMRVVPEGR